MSLGCQKIYFEVYGVVKQSKKNVARENKSSYDFFVNGNACRASYK